MTMSMIHIDYFKYSELFDKICNEKIAVIKIIKLNKLHKKVSELQERNSRLVGPGIYCSAALDPGYFTSLLGKIEAARNELLKNN